MFIYLVYSSVFANVLKTSACGHDKPLLKNAPLAVVSVPTVRPYSVAV